MRFKARIASDKLYHLCSLVAVFEKMGSSCVVFLRSVAVARYANIRFVAI
jgi:hypothetical protein